MPWEAPTVRIRRDGRDELPLAERCRLAVVEFFAWDLDAAYHASVTHTPDVHGWCLGCQSQTRPVKSPCLVHDLAERAIQLHEETWVDESRSACA